LRKFYSSPIFCTAGEGGKIAATVAGGAFGGVQGAVAGFQAGSMFSKFLGGK